MDHHTQHPGHQQDLLKEHQHDQSAGFNSHADCQAVNAAPQLRPVFNITATAGFIPPPDFFYGGGAAAASPHAAWQGSPHKTRSAESKDVDASHNREGSVEETAAEQDHDDAAIFGKIPRKKRTQQPTPTLDATNTHQPVHPAKRAVPSVTDRQTYSTHRGETGQAKRQRVAAPEYSDSSYRGPHGAPVHFNPYAHGSSRGLPHLSSFQGPLQGPLHDPAYLLQGLPQGTTQPVEYRGATQSVDMPYRGPVGAHMGQMHVHSETDELAAAYVERLLAEVRHRGGSVESSKVLTALEGILAEYHGAKAAHPHMHYPGMHLHGPHPTLPHLHALPEPAHHPNQPHNRRIMMQAKARLPPIPDDSPTSPYDDGRGRTALFERGARGAKRPHRGPHAGPRTKGPSYWQPQGNDALRSLAGVAYMLDHPEHHTNPKPHHVSPKPRTHNRRAAAKREDEHEYDPAFDEEVAPVQHEGDEGEFEGSLGPRGGGPHGRGAARRGAAVGMAAGKGRHAHGSDVKGASEDTSAADVAGPPGPIANWQSQPGVCKPDGKKRGSSRKRLRQIEVLLAMNLLNELDVLHYKSKSGKIMASGTVKGNGICCHRCNQIVGCTEFERCAGSGLRRPCDNIFTEDGTSLQELLQRADLLMLSGAKAIGQQGGGPAPSPSIGAHSGEHVNAVGTENAARIEDATENNHAEQIATAENENGKAVEGHVNSSADALEHLAAAALDQGLIPTAQDGVC